MIDHFTMGLLQRELFLVYKFNYLIKREVLGVGPLEPLIRDPYIEDIHVIGPHNTHIVHKIFEMMPTNIDFKDEIYMSEYLKNMGERIGRPVSEREPVVDEGDRIEKVKAVDCVDKVLFGDDWPTNDRYGLLGRLKFDIVALGYDQRPSIAEITRELQVIGKSDVSIVRLESYNSDKYKSSYFR